MCMNGFSAKASSSDEYCPHCDNHYVLEARTPTAALNVESEDVRKDSRMLRDDRIQADDRRSIFEAADRLG